MFFFALMNLFLFFYGHPSLEFYSTSRFNFFDYFFTNIYFFLIKNIKRFDCFFDHQTFPLFQPSWTLPNKIFFFPPLKYRPNGIGILHDLIFIQLTQLFPTKMFMISQGCFQTQLKPPFYIHHLHFMFIAKCSCLFIINICKVITGSWPSFYELHTMLCLQFSVYARIIRPAEERWRV